MVGHAAAGAGGTARAVTARCVCGNRVGNRNIKQQTAPDVFSSLFCHPFVPVVLMRVLAGLAIVALLAVGVFAAHASTGRDSLPSNEADPRPGSNLTHTECTGRDSLACNDALHSGSKCVERCFIAMFNATIDNECVPSLCDDDSEECPVRIAIRTNPCTDCECGRYNSDGEALKNHCMLRRYNISFGGQCVNSALVYDNNQHGVFKLLRVGEIAEIGLSTGYWDTFLSMLFTKWWGHHEWPTTPFADEYFAPEVEIPEESTETSEFSAKCPCPSTLAGAVRTLDDVEIECVGVDDGCSPRNTWLSANIHNYLHQVPCANLDALWRAGCPPPV